MPNDIDVYLKSFTGLKLTRLTEMRSILRSVLPDAEECLSYGMPAYRLGKVLVYFAGNKEHIGFYPTPGPIKEFAHELSQWKYSKGAIQFPYSEPLPLKLIVKIASKRLHDIVKQDSSKHCSLRTNPKKAKEFDAAIRTMESELYQSGLAKPALRALINLNVYTIAELKSIKSETLSQAHGIGSKAMEILLQLKNQ